ncbi:hypothetical protein Tco_1372793, partial [Tanacetum coccineum]
YTAEADSVMKLITFTLSHFEKPLSFDLDVISTVIGLEHSEDFVSITPKETMKAGLATLRLTDKNDTTLSSSDLINSSPVKIKYFSPKWRILMQYIVKCLRGMRGSHDQLNVNQQTITYCLYWGLNVDIAMAELSPNPIKSLLPHYRKENANDSTDKSSFGTSVQPIIQPKAPIDLKPKKKRVSPSSKPKFSKHVQETIAEKFKLVDKPEDEDTRINSVLISMGDEPTDSDLPSIPDDEVVSISGFGTDDSNKEGTIDNLIDEMIDLILPLPSHQTPLVIFVRIRQISQENRQKRANTDTRNGRAQEKPEIQSRSQEKVKL